MCRHLLDRQTLETFPVEALGLDAVKRLVVTQFPRQPMQKQRAARAAVHAEERGPRAILLYRNQRGIIRDLRRRT